VKLLLNMNVLPQLGPRLVAVGHPCRHARDIGLERAEDPEIIAAARAGGEVIVTHDLDYGHLLAFSGEAGPSVIIFRVRNTHPDTSFEQLPECAPRLLENCGRDPERRAAEPIEGRSGLGFTEPTGRCSPQDHAERSVDFQPDQLCNHPRFGVIGQQPVRVQQPRQCDRFSLTCPEFPRELPEDRVIALL
jgi:predicted nuclease of predicted toxin-antitoxin system